MLSGIKHKSKIILFKKFLSPLIRCVIHLVYSWRARRRLVPFCPPTERLACPAVIEHSVRPNIDSVAAEDLNWTELKWAVWPSSVK